MTLFESNDFVFVLKCGGYPPNVPFPKPKNC